MEKKLVKIDITWRSLFRVFVFSLFVLSLFLFKKIILWLFLALVISFLFNPMIDVIERKKVSRGLSTIIVYGVFLILVALIFFSIFPPLIKEISNLSVNFPLYFEHIKVFLESHGVEIKDFNNMINIFKEQFLGIIVFAKNIVENVFAFVTILTLAIFLSIEKEFPINFARVFAIKEETEKKVLSSFTESQRQVVGYFNAKIVSSIFIGVGTLIFLSIFKIRYAVSLSLIAFVSNIIPIIGPIIACILMMFFAAFDSGLKAILVLVFFTIIQQIEGNVLIPILTKRMIGIPPVLVLVSVLVGATLGGVLGAIFIIPIAGILYEFTLRYFEDKKEKVRRIK